MNYGMAKAIRKDHRAVEPERFVLKLHLLVIAFFFCRTISCLPHFWREPCSRWSELGYVLRMILLISFACGSSYCNEAEMG